MTERGARFARWLVRLGHRRPWTAIGLAVAVIAAGVALSMRLTFETDVLSLMPRHDPVVERFQQVLQEFGSLDTLLVAVPIRDESLDVGFTMVDRLAASLAKSPYISSVDARLEDPLQLADTVLRHGLLFLDQEGLDQLAQRLTPSGLDHRAADIRASLDTPHGILGKELAVRDPLGLLPMLLGRLSRAPANLRIDYSSGYYLAADHSMLLILAKPTEPAQNISFDERLFSDLRERVAHVRAEVAGEIETPEKDLPEVLLGGGHRIALEDASLIRRDIIVNSATSVVGVMVLFFLAYRRFSAAHLAFLPLMVGLAMTFAFTALVVGRLNSATSGFAALLVGLGIDFTIVLYGRYLEARHNGLSTAEALDDMADHSGPAVLLGAITTVGTFFAFFATRFAGLRELGLLTGTGIIFMAVSAFLLLPALVTVVHREKLPPKPSRWLDVLPAMRFADRHRRGILMSSGVLTLVALAAIPSVRFDDDVRNLRSPSNQGVAIQERVVDAFGLTFNSMMIRVEAPDSAEMMTRIQSLSPGLDRLVRDGVISSYESLASLVPPMEGQERVLKWVDAHRELTDPLRVRAELGAAMARHGLNESAFAPALGALDEMLRPRGTVSLSMWQGTPVEKFIARSMRDVPGGVASVINVFAPAGMWRRQAPPQLETLVASTAGASLTGINVVSERLRRMVWQDAALAGLAGLVIVFVLLLWELRALRAALACLVPVGLGVVWTVGAMALLGFALNFLNVFVVTMVIGVGVDYGIHIMHRLRQDNDLDGLAETARAVVFAALTTTVGFGSLITTHYPGLQSIGWMTSLGVLLSCYAAVIILPLLVRRRG